MKQLIRTLALLIALPIAQAQTITDFVPKNGKETTTITITGTGFTASNYYVQFGAGTFVAATITDATEITADVPSDASEGNIKVSSDAAGSTVVATTSSLSDDFRHVSVTDVQPNPAEIGEIITFTGTGFATIGVPTLGTSALFRVLFNNCAASFVTFSQSINSTGTIAMVQVPFCARSGNMTVTVSKNHGEDSPDYEDYEFERSLTVNILTPEITSFTPTEEAVGRMVEIMGTGFASTATNNEVAFGSGNFDAMGESITENSGTQTLTVRVPKEAENGKIKVKTGTRTGTSMGRFMRLNHTVASFAPTTFVGGVDKITITGTNFSTRRADNEVCFETSSNTNCIEATSVNADGTELKITPPEATAQETGTLKIKIGDVEVDAGTFTNDPRPAFTFTSIDPTTAHMGETVTLIGTGFDPDLSDNSITLGTTARNTRSIVHAYEVNEDQTEMKIRIPPDIRGIETTIGNIFIRECVEDCDTGSPGYEWHEVSGLTIPVTPTLAITDISPQTFHKGDEVTITGTGFSRYAKHSEVIFGGAPTRVVGAPKAHYVNEDGTELKVGVDPDHARRGSQAVTVFYSTLPTTTTTFGTNVTINDARTPNVSNFLPSSGPEGTELTINGSNFALYAKHNEVVFTLSGAETTAKAHWVKEDGTQLRVNVPNLGSQAANFSVEVKVDTKKGAASTSFSYNPGAMPPPPPPATPSPIVSSFMPNMGPVGTNVTITGHNFSDTPAENTITFGGGVDAGVPSSATTTSLTVQVPSGATTGPITVTVSGQTGTSQSNFTVSSTQPPPPPGTPSPIVSSFLPNMGAVGTDVTIMGQNFSDVPAENTITFGGGVEAGVPSSATTTSLTVNVPSGATTGPITVTVSGQTGTSQSTFTVSGTQPPTPPGTPAPIVSSFMPEMGAVGTNVTITGQNFSDVPEENTITFGGGVDATPSASTTTSLTVQVPSGATTGPITVTVSGQTGTSQSNFTVKAGVFSVPTSEGDIRVYPNPTSGELQFTGLSFTATYMYKIYSLLGQEIEKGVLQGNSSIDLSSLLGGQYVLVLQTEGEELLRTRLLMLKK